MERQNVMDDLCQQLAAFHISARLERLTEDEQLLKEPKLESGRFKMKTFQQTSSVYLCRPGLPPPKLKAGKRPCWEPPILDYSWLEILLNAQKEMATRDGNEEISWRTDIMDNIIEGEILYTVYSPWVKRQAVRARHPQEMAFLRGLEVALREEMGDVNEEGRAIRIAHGKSASDSAELRDRVVQIAWEMEPEFLERWPKLGLSTRLREVEFAPFERQDS